MAMQKASFLATLLSLTTGVWFVLSPAILSGQLPDGRIFFDRSPRLLDATTPYNQTRIRNVPYYFTVEIPENVGKPLGKILIQQRQGLANIQFRLSETTAFVGTSSDRGEPLSIGEVAIDAQTGGVSVTFDPPVSPGQTITISLVAAMNPSQSGVYLFGVTAFPAGDEVLSLYLGPGRLQFYRDEGILLND
jgi:Protein of unknown function (DUF2808)